jgi:hypothetical protein
LRRKPVRECRVPNVAGAVDYQVSVSDFTSGEIVAEAMFQVEGS